MSGGVVSGREALAERLAEALCRERDPGEHSPLCWGGDCHYCRDLAQALLPVVELEIAAARVPAVFLADDHEECSHAERAAYERGRAEVVARVEAVARKGTSGRWIITQDDLRAALAPQDPA